MAALSSSVSTFTITDPDIHILATARYKSIACGLIACVHQPVLQNDKSQRLPVNGSRWCYLYF